MTERKNKGGRPKKALSHEQIIQVEALGAVLSIEQIANYFRMSKSTFYSVMERQPEILERYKRGKSIAIVNAGKGLLKLVREGNLGAIIFYLKTQAGWRERTQVDISSEDGTLRAPTVIELVAGTTSTGGTTGETG